MEAQLIGSRMRRPVGALAAAVALAITVGIVATQSARIASEPVSD